MHFGGENLQYEGATFQKGCSFRCNLPEDPGVSESFACKYRWICRNISGVSSKILLRQKVLQRRQVYSTKDTRLDVFRARCGAHGPGHPGGLRGPGRYGVCTVSSSKLKVVITF